MGLIPRECGKPVGEFLYIWYRYTKQYGQLALSMYWRKIEMKTVSEIEQLVAEETKHRLEEMESPEYEFPKQFLRKDFILVALAVIINLLLIILAMTGGIQ